MQPLEKDYTMVLTGFQTNSNSEFALKQKYNFLGFQMRFSLIIFIIIREPSQITFAFFGIWPRTYPP